MRLNTVYTEFSLISRCVLFFLQTAALCALTVFSSQASPLASGLVASESGESARRGSSCQKIGVDSFLFAISNANKKKTNLLDLHRTSRGTFNFLCGGDGGAASEVENILFSVASHCSSIKTPTGLARAAFLQGLLCDSDKSKNNMCT